MKKSLTNKQFAITLISTQLIQGMLILSCRYPSLHWMAVINIIATIMILYKHFSDNE